MVAIQELELYQETAEETPCQHHWMLESPSGRVLTGFCKMCGASRQFNTAGVDMAWENDGAPILQTKQKDTVSVLVGGET